jgi:hypothetical protein
VYSIPNSALEDLADDPEVAYISPDRPLYPALDSAEYAVNANIAFQSCYTGKGVTT